MNNLVKNNRLIIVPLLFCFFVGVAFAKMDSGTDNTKDGKKFWQKSTITAVVQKVDKKNNEVTLKGPKGNEVTVNVGKDIDLSNVKEGDSVKAQYYRSIATKIEKPSKDQEKEGFTILESKSISPAGVDIAAGALRQVKAVAKIVNVNKAANEVTIEGPKGQEITIKVPESKMLDNVKEGENAVLEYTQAIATKLEKVK